ncbi:MAG TPA: S53 family serine peptidase [Streptosporangiaceae bacterium]|nr:S53 family serine peptidase [Streptosporangiaceae bacterium]
MRLTRRPMRAGFIAVLGLAMCGTTGAFASSALASPAASTPRFVALSGSATATTDHATGSYSSSRMSVEVALAPRNSAALNSLLRALYTKGSGRYERWLAKGQFDALFAPKAATRSAVASYLRQEGLKVGASSSPFLVSAVGSSKQISAAFQTSLHTYTGTRGVTFFANSGAVRVPASLASGVIGVIGLTNTVRAKDMVVPDKPARGAAKGSASSNAGCETPYPTPSQLVDIYFNDENVPLGYGGGPGCSGLTPSQTNSLYGAPDVGPRGKGAGGTTAVFELSAYLSSDISHWAHNYYGKNYTPPLSNVTVDGGPLNPKCPAGDTCPSFAEGYAGDIEVDADIEQQLTIAPDVSHLIVYNAPNDETGQTELDEYTKIANQDVASTISTSWGECEAAEGAAMAQAENVVFEQMAVQGQSIFASAGDDGAFDCLDATGTTAAAVDDPASQPWVTSAGGTSWQNFNPGTNPHPAYPAGVESVWNVDQLCNTSADEGGQTGLTWCNTTGAGGGGTSSFWGRPFYQRGPGINNKFTTFGNGSTNCALAAKGTPCREVPDISAGADQFTPYSEYCTGNANTPNSVCATLGDIELVPGWFGIGGTSLSSPFWGALAADRDSYQGHRSGNFNPLVYTLYNQDPSRYFHDITGIGQHTVTNGLFPTTPGYDLATGIGTPKLAELITGS